VNNQTNIKQEKDIITAFSLDTKKNRGLIIELNSQPEIKDSLLAFYNAVKEKVGELFAKSFDLVNMFWYDRYGYYLNLKVQNEQAAKAVSQILTEYQELLHSSVKIHITVAP
jgi:hypothetical protein